MTILRLGNHVDGRKPPPVNTGTRSDGTHLLHNIVSLSILTKPPNRLPKGSAAAVEVHVCYDVCTRVKSSNYAPQIARISQTTNPTKFYLIKRE